jgi:hypothetical protein
MDYEENMENARYATNEPTIEEGQAIQWSKYIGQTTIYKTTHRTKDRATRTPPKDGNDLNVPEETAVPLPHVVPFVLLFLQF